MTGCMPIAFGRTNDTPDATLTSDRAPDTSIDWLKNEFKSRPVKWPGNNQLVITGTFAEFKYAEYFSIPESNLVQENFVQVELFENDTSGPDLLQMDPISVYDIIALGQWRAGVDAYNLGEDTGVLAALTYWFGVIIKYKVFRITIFSSPSSTEPDIRLRTFLIGEKLKLEKNFEYGNEITFMSEPELERTSSGSYFPVRGQRMNRVLSINLSQSTDVDRALMSRFEYNLNGQPFIVSAYPDRKGWQFNEYTFLARFFNALGYGQRYEDIHTINNLTLVEV